MLYFSDASRLLYVHCDYETEGISVQQATVCSQRLLDRGDICSCVLVEEVMLIFVIKITSWLLTFVAFFCSYPRFGENPVGILLQVFIHAPVQYLARGIMFSGCPSVCVCVRPCQPGQGIEVIPDRPAVDLQFQLNELALPRFQEVIEKYRCEFRQQISRSNNGLVSLFFRLSVW